MNGIQKIALAVVTVAGITAAVLPDRQTVPVLSTIFKGFNNALKTSEGR